MQGSGQESRGKCFKIQDLLKTLRFCFAGLRGGHGDET